MPSCARTAPWTTTPNLVHPRSTVLGRPSPDVGRCRRTHASTAPVSGADWSKTRDNSPQEQLRSVTAGPLGLRPGAQPFVDRTIDALDGCGRRPCNSALSACRPVGSAAATGAGTTFANQRRPFERLSVQALMWLYWDACRTDRCFIAVFSATAETTEARRVWMADRGQRVPAS